MKALTKKEELILLAISHLGDEAYLIAIQRHLEDVLQKSILLTAIHVPLSRLEKRQLIKSGFSGATAVRGGRRKKIYHLTREGHQALAESKRINDFMWSKYRGFNPKEI